MPNTVLERILYLTSIGFDVRIRPCPPEGCIEIRLSKDDHHVARVCDPKISRQSYAWASEEEWFLYNLAHIELQYQDYVRRIRETLT